MHARPTMSHLASVLPASDDDSGLPNQNDGEYQPHSRPSNKPVFALHLISSSWEVRTFQYCDLDSDSRYTPEAIHLRFTGTQVQNVVIHGRGLWKLYEYLHRQLISWILEGRDFAEDEQCVITRIDTVPAAL